MYRVFAPTFASHWRALLWVISRPLSERMCSGTPRMSITSAIVSRTPRLLIRRATRIARHSRVGWLAWRDVVSVDLGLLRPAPDRHAGQLGAVVVDDRLGSATTGNDRVEFKAE